MDLPRCLLVLLLVSCLTRLRLAATTYYTHKGLEKCNPCCRGHPGPPGTPGMPGIPAARAVNGAPGSKGDKGDMGSQGFIGRRGDTGPQGARGRRGSKGNEGDCGAPGVQGEKGEIGPQGPAGPRGEQGRQGEKGEQPARIAFSVSLRERVGPVSQITSVVFDEIHLNVGDSFDAYSSHFICKVNGTYLFTVHVLSLENETAYGWIMLNKDHRIAFHGDASARHGTGSNTIILRLVKDDHVWVQLNTNSTILNGFSSFSGHILFED